ncbi:hypothetical protein [Comamonas suwonensis]|uniref:Uncharacterized protein n=1 Tax=Comamonas suwonensis TaxID=2606214 RepID=A0A843B897_9BURK|nr:hypothetical protein [Comamonas suwonensis]MBI1627051.1 hypothetical protein [Comamonas suwonensis]
MLNFLDITPKAVKRRSREIFSPPHQPTRIHRLLGNGSGPSLPSPTVLSRKPPAGTQNTPDLPASSHGTKPEAIEIAHVMALVAELTALVAQLRPLAVPPVTGSESPPPKQKRKYTPRKTDQKVEAVPLIDRKWITFKQAAALYPKSEQAFRHLAHKSSQYLKYPKANLRSNGFEACVVRQPGSRNVYLNAEELERWMAQGQGDAQ